MQRTLGFLTVLTITVLAGCTANAVEVGEGQSVDAVTAPTEDNCLDGQDMDAADVDVSACPALPTSPNSVRLGGASVGLGLWELGTTADGETYKYSSLSAPNAEGARNLGNYGPVKKDNLVCWAKGYYRLRKMMQDPPREYLALRDAGFQRSFFQFQTDLRNGSTGFRQISSYRDHLVKWVTVITREGVCEQPTLSKFRDYAKRELTRRDITLPPAEPASPAPEAPAPSNP